MTVQLGQCHGLDAITLQAADGACAVLTLYGAHVVSWIPAGGGEMLYLSPRSAFAPGQSIRGGVPVIFPQFSTRGSGLRHGFARVLPWQLVSEEQFLGGAGAVLRLTDSAATRAAWDHRFELELVVRVGGDRLSLTLACRNTGASGFDFMAALHTYLRTESIGQTWLHGLAGRPYWDATDGVDKLQRADELKFDGELDRVYGGVAGDLSLYAPVAGSGRRIGIRQSGFEDVVVWNPGALKCAGLADMPPDGWRHMVCVEAARVERPSVLQPGELWQGTQILSLSDGAAANQ
jgi:glucose-6-phosphate 1-epimerase